MDELKDGASIAVIEGLVDDMKNCEYITIPHTIEGIAHVFVDNRVFEGHFSPAVVIIWMYQ